MNLASWFNISKKKKPNKLEANLKLIESVDNKKAFGDEYFPLEGLSLNFILDYLASFNFRDGNDVEDFVYKLTETHACSFVELLSAHPEYAGTVKPKADYFVSFAYTASFLDLLTALKVFKEKSDKEDLYIWMSVFSITIDFNKRSPPLTTTQWFENTFKNLIPELGATLFTLSPWKEPISLNRLWCIAELYFTIENDNCELHILLSERDEENFANELLKDVAKLVNYISSIKVENAEIGRLQDQSLSAERKNEIKDTRTKILGYFNSIDGGYDLVNEEIKGRLRLWFAETSERTLEKNKSAYKGQPKDLCKLLNAIAFLYREQGLLQKSRKHFDALITLARQTFPKDDVTLAKYLNNVGVLLSNQGKFAEAEAPQREALAIWKKALGADHPQVAVGMNNLSQLLTEMGRYDEALELAYDALAIKEQTIGKEHPSYALQLNNISQLLKAQGKYEEAYKVQRDAMRIRKQALGPEHPLYASDLNNLSSLLCDMGKFQEAEAPQREALAIWKKTLGENHPQVAIGLNNLSGLLESQGKVDEAELLIREVLRIQEKTIGKEHPLYASSLNNLSALLNKMGRTDEALELAYEALAIKEQTTGKEHPSYALQLNNISVFLMETGRREEAKKLGMQAYNIALNTLGADHPNTKIYSDWLRFEV